MSHLDSYDDFNKNLDLKGALDKFLFILYKKKICHRFSQTRAPSNFFILSNFVKPHQSSKAPSSCLGAGQIFVCVKTDRFSIYKPQFKEILQSRKFDFASSRRPPKYLIFTRQSNSQDGTCARDLGKFLLAFATVDY